MNNLRNRVQLIGHLGANPELKEFGSGNKLAQLRLATNESYKAADGEWKEQTQWHRIGVWDKLAERAISQMHKGSYIMVEGKLINREYLDKNGEKKYSTEVRAFNILVLDKKEGGNAPMSINTATNNEEDLPF